jgi:hypothetical protein
MTDICAHHRQRLRRVRQGQQIVMMPTVHGAPAQVIGDEAGSEALHQSPQANKMPRVQTLGRTEREADAVQAARIAVAEAFELGQRLAAGSKIVLGVYFHKTEGGQALQ